jgi:predicted nucleotidyltransferase
VLEFLVERTLGSRGRIAVLRQLHRFPPGFSTSARNLAAAGGIDHRVAQRSLDELVDIGIVMVHRTSAANYYELNPGHVLASPLARLFKVDRDLGTELREHLSAELQERGLTVRAAYIFGSVARGEDRPSDVDVALICEEGAQAGIKDALDDITAELTRRFGTHFQFVMAAKSLDEMTRIEGDPAGLWHSVKKEGLVLL